MNFDKIKKYYEKGFWTKEMVQKALEKNVITQQEYKSIIKKDNEVTINEEKKI